MYKVKKVGIVRESVESSAFPCRFTWNCSKTYLQNNLLEKPKLLI